jgi:hypothetical protein
MAKHEIFTAMNVHDFLGVLTPVTYITTRYQNPKDHHVYLLHKVTSAPGDVKLTTHLRIVPRLRMHEAEPPLPQYVFTSWSVVKQEIRLHDVVVG